MAEIANRSGEPITSPYVAVLATAGSVLLALILVLLDVKESLYWGSALAVGLFALIVHFVLIWDKTINRRFTTKSLIVILVGCGYFWLVGKQVLAKYRQEHVTEASLDQRYVAIGKTTVQDLYRSDFPQTFKLSGSGLQGFADGVPFLTQSQVYEDLSEHAMFVRFYIPRSAQAYKLCAALSEQSFKQFERARQISVTTVDSTQEMSTKDLTFTGRVFVYHEDHFEPMEIASLSKLYQAKGLSVVFRGPEYLRIRMEGMWIDAKAKSKAP